MAVGPTLSELREAKAHYARGLLDRPEAHAVGIGLRGDPSDDVPEPELALIVLLERPQPSGLPPDQQIPSVLPLPGRGPDEQVEISVEAWVAPPPKRGAASGLNPAVLEGKHRPAPGGVSLGQELVWESGTLGGWVWDRIQDCIVLLTNRHVIQDPTRTTPFLQQPSYPDASDHPPIVGSRFAKRTRVYPPFPPGHPEYNEWSHCDAGIAEPLDPHSFSATILNLGPAVFEVDDPNPLSLETVLKVGRRTGMSRGRVRVVELEGLYSCPGDFMIVGDWNEGCTWDPKIPAKTFSDKGDSGSLVVRQNMADGTSWRVVLGLLYGDGTADINGVEHFVSYANPIKNVFGWLSLAPICSGLIESLIASTLLGSSLTRVHAAPGSLEGEPPSASSSGRFAVPPSDRSAESGGSGLWGLYAGFARFFQRRISGSETGSGFIGLLDRYRVEVAAVLLNPDGWRATVNALAPFLAGKLTTDQVLESPITEDELERIQLALHTAVRIEPGVQPLTTFVAEQLTDAVGKRLGAVIFGDASDWGGSG